MLRGRISGNQVVPAYPFFRFQINAARAIAATTRISGPIASNICTGLGVGEDEIGGRGMRMDELEVTVTCMFPLELAVVPLRALFDLYR